MFLCLDIIFQKRHRADDEINMREVDVLRDGSWQKIQWRRVSVGDVVKVSLIFFDKSFSDEFSDKDS